MRSLFRIPVVKVVKSIPCRFFKPTHYRNMFTKAFISHGIKHLKRNVVKLGEKDLCFFNSSETVFALSSGHGKCGVAVVRATGPGAKEALLQLTGKASPPKPRLAVFGKLVEPQTGETIDHALTLWFPGPASFTGEDMVEFQTHGGPAVVLALLQALETIPGCRHALPGDFTKRAFFNGKLGLTEVEGLGDLIHAETEAQRKQAVRQMEGDLQNLYQRWRTSLIKLLAHVEAEIDFGEDENIEEGVVEQVATDVKKLLAEVEHHLDDGRRGERLRSGVHVTIVGPPNAGKSSLLNILCQRPAAIVSPQAGTTRDVLESALDIFGYPVVISDTAGLRDSADPIEKEGVRRALKKAETADLKILISDINTVPAHTLQTIQAVSMPKHLVSLPEVAKQLLALSDVDKDWSSGATDVFTPDDTLVVLNKLDLVTPNEDACNTAPEILNRLHEQRIAAVTYMSCKTGEGVDNFMANLREMLKRMCGNPLAGNPSITQARHRHHLLLCSDHLTHFLKLVGGNKEETEFSLDLAAEALREAVQELGRVTGKVGVEDILDVVFKDFCIGK